jgi:GT2 family glycosyltransferase
VTRVTAIVLAYGEEPHLVECVDALLASEGVDLDVVLVDNLCTSREAVAELRSRHHVSVEEPGENLGYAGGNNLGAKAATADTFVFVNSDAIVTPTAVRKLIDALTDDVRLVTASIRLADEPELLNAAGNPLNILGVAWAGNFREPADRYPVERAVTLISGATYACQRRTWEALGGFDDAYFAYHEDTEISVRCWQRGWQIHYIPDAVVLHHYEFSRNPRKLYLIERNRLLNLFTLWQLRTLAVLAPVLIGFEFAMLGLAAKQRWFNAKLEGYAWLWQHRDHIQRRRRRVQSERTQADADLAHLLTPAITAANYQLPAGIRIVNTVLSAYWWVARRFI